MKLKFETNEDGSYYTLSNETNNYGYTLTKWTPTKTEDAKNVLIYQKLGFELVHETLLKSSALKSWVMRYKSQRWVI